MSLDLEAIKLEMLEEYEDRGKIDLKRLLTEYPEFATELMDYALWLRGTPKTESSPDERWDDEGAEAESALEAACRAADARTIGRENRSVRRWTHPSVLELAGDRDPIGVITEHARTLVVKAMDAGWSGPPFDPITLAELIGIPVIGRSDIRDARVVPVPQGHLQIEFNPNRPPARVRYSLAHEIAHTLFPDCRAQIRNRAGRHEIMGDEWQLEALCNIAAAEMLMPIGTLPRFIGEELSIDRLVEKRKEYQVSAEALIIRAARLAAEPCAAFCATRIEGGLNSGRYRLDYTIASDTWGGETPRSILLPSDTRLRECTAIGYTAKTSEDWQEIGEVYLEGLGISPYPGSSYPRVIGLLHSERVARREPCITYLVGDATEPRRYGPTIIVHVVNDATPRWGGGFALAVRKRWKQVQDDFIEWVGEDRSHLRLGRMHEFELDPSCWIVHMIAQHGYGLASTPRIRYVALRECLQDVATLAKERRASVHMPRIGAGQGGGSWRLVEELITSTLCADGVRVYVYDLPGQVLPSRPQLALEI